MKIRPGKYGNCVYTVDFLVIGGGIIGINIALRLKEKFSDSDVVVLEKEQSLGIHASGRNSGVLHAGFYYTADSLKAKFTRDGNALLTKYCEQKKIPINKCGKLVVALNEKEDKLLDLLMERGVKNGVDLQQVSKDEMHEIEPRAYSWDRAIFSPTTSSADPIAVIKAMEEDAKRAGINIHYGAKYLNNKHNKIETTNGFYSAKYVVNAAGLYADKVARDFKFCNNYTILPFKGIYLKSNEPAGVYQTHIYPVPDLENPFLGVHFTIQVDGKVKIGPTAIPAFWREQYKYLDNFKLNEFVDISSRSAGLLLHSNFNFSRLAVNEIKKYSRKRLVKLASGLVPDVPHNSFKQWAKPGIRAQLIDLKSRKLEMDFVLEGDNKSMHVLNAVSPGWTCSISFSKHVVSEISRRLNE